MATKTNIKFNMCFKTIFSILLIFLVFSNTVKGSCLEYGHSCWGAHGKRSGSPSAAQPRNEDLTINANDQLANKALFKDLNDYLLTVEKSDHPGSFEEPNPERNNPSKLKNLSNNQKYKIRNRNSQLEETTEPSKRNEIPYMHRWQRLPLFGVKSYGKLQLPAQAQIQTLDNGDLLLTQLDGQPNPGRDVLGVADENNYYDFQ